MKILITSIVDPQKAAHNRLHEFVSYLTSRNHQITMICLNDWWKAKQVSADMYDESLKQALHKVNIKYFTERKISPVLQELFSPLLLRRYLGELGIGSYAVHLNYGTLISGYFITRIMRGLGINTVYDMGDDNPQMIRTSPQIPSMLRAAGGLLGRIMFKKNIQEAKVVTYTIDSLKDAYGVPDIKGVQVLNGVNIQNFRRLPARRLRKKLGITDNDFVVGFVGVLREWIDLEPIYAAVSNLAGSHENLRMLIVGEEGGLGRQKELTRRYNISDRVIFTGTVPYALVPEYISSMDVGLIARRSDPVAEKMLPLKMFEYMACETPVIAARFEGITRAVGDKVLYASNTPEYQDSITQLYQDRSRGVRMGKEGRKLVERNYSWASSCAKLEEVLLEMVEKAG